PLAITQLAICRTSFDARSGRRSARFSVAVALLGDRPADSTARQKTRAVAAVFRGSRMPIAPQLPGSVAVLLGGMERRHIGQGRRRSGWDDRGRLAPPRLH